MTSPYGKAPPGTSTQRNKSYIFVKTSQQTTSFTGGNSNADQHCYGTLGKSFTASFRFHATARKWRSLTMAAGVETCTCNLLVGVRSRECWRLGTGQRIVVSFRVHVVLNCEPAEALPRVCVVNNVIESYCCIVPSCVQSIHLSGQSLFSLL